MTRRPAQPSEAGFTLLEVLVAVVIVALTVTIFFQLLSSSIRLEIKGREQIDIVLAASQIFDTVMEAAINEPEFDFWEGEEDGISWDLTILEMENVSLLAEDEIPMRVDKNLYKFILAVHYGTDRKKTMRLYRYKAYEPNFFPQDFVNAHVKELEAE